MSPSEHYPRPTNTYKYMYFHTDIGESVSNYIRYRKKRVYGKFKQIHRLIWEEHHGPIPDGCIIHHIDGDSLNNDIDNLQMLTVRKHNKIHASTLTGSIYLKRCPYCGEVKSIFTDYYGKPSKVRSYCKECTKFKNRVRYNITKERQKRRERYETRRTQKDL